MLMTIAHQFDIADSTIQDLTEMKVGILPSRISVEMILRDQELRVRLLRLFERGKIDIFVQERLFQWIFLASFKGYRTVREDVVQAFVEAMDSMHEKADKWFEAYAHPQEITISDASEYLGFGGDAAVINYGMRVVRLLANREAYKHLGYKYGSQRKSRVVDYPAKVTVLVSNPEDSQYARSFAGSYLSGATIKKAGDRVWTINFDEYFLAQEPEFLWNLDLWYKIFCAIKPQLEFLFQAEISFRREDQFNN